MLRLPRILLVAAGLLLIGAAIGLADMLRGDREILYILIPQELYVSLALPLLAIPLLIACVISTVTAWKRRAWTLGTRLHYTAATLALLGVLWIFNYWNLLGYRFG